MSSVHQTQVDTDDIALFVVIQQVVAIAVKQLNVVAQAGVTGRGSRGHQPVDSGQAFTFTAQRMPHRCAQGVGLVDLLGAAQFGAAHKIFNAWVVVGV